MSLLAATLIPGIVLLLVGLPLLMRSATVMAALRAFPRSPGATYVLFGIGSAWFLCNIWSLSEADFGNYHVLLTVAFALIAILSFKCVPDFLAVRGLAVIILLAAFPLLMAGYLTFDHPQLYLKNSVVYVGIAAAIWLGAQPWRMRDFLEWLFARPERTRLVGGALTACGVLLAAAAFTY